MFTVALWETDHAQIKLPNQLNEIQNGVGVGAVSYFRQNYSFGFEMFHKIKSFIHEAVEAVSKILMLYFSHVYFLVRFLDRCVGRTRISDPASI